MNEKNDIQNSENALIEMRGVTVTTMRDNSFVVLKNVDWSVAREDFWVVAGSQHSGKSDLTLLAAGLMPPLSGYFQLFGNDPQNFDETHLEQRLRIGVVLENAQLFSHLTIAENVALPLRYHKNLTAADAANAVNLLLELMELSPLADVTPANVAASWRHRAALARALIMNPELLLLDNPLGGLTWSHLFWWTRFLDQLWRGHDFFGGRPMTIVATTDDLRPWKNTRRKFALLNEQKFIPLGSWNEVETINDPAVKELLALHFETAEASAEKIN
jgi:ABC-type transporter Mla maintaining outer membrane lipid asymmetry ATPase subunit MlaF